MSDSVRSRLEQLATRFQQAAEKYAGLRHQLIYGPISDTALPDAAWKAFQEKHCQTAEEQEIEILPGNRYLSRFLGNRKGYVAFQDVAQDAYHLLCDIDSSLDRKQSYFGWLRVIHNMAYWCPVAGLDQNTRLWNFDDATDEIESWDAIEEEEEIEGILLPVHPLCVSIGGDVCQASAVAMGLFLDPYESEFVGNDPQPTLYPWFLAAVFANTGIIDRTADEIAGSNLQAIIGQIDAIAKNEFKPHFTGNDLMLRQTVVRKIRAGSTNLISILKAFEDDGWPPEIDTPLDGLEVEKHTRDAVAKLNRGQQGPMRIAFHFRENGRKIYWTLPDAI